MSKLNQYELSRLLGSKVQPIKGGRLGGFGLLQTTSEVLKATERHRNQCGDSSKFGYEQDRVVVQAFEDVRDGASTDALLWDLNLRDQFLARCRELGFDSPAQLLNRRLINVRKNKSRYEKHGIVLSSTTRIEPKPTIASEFAPVVEFALVALRYRYGASIDDILIDPALSSELEQLAQKIAPDLLGEDLRRGSLYIRKSRYIKTREEAEIRSLDIRIVQAVFSQPQPLSEIVVESLPEKPGIVEIDENSRHLYVARSQNIQPLVRELVLGKVFQIVQNTFWEADSSHITMKFVCGDKIAGTSIQKWEHRLIHDFNPIFNWPMHKIAV